MGVAANYNKGSKEHSFVSCGPLYYAGDYFFHIGRNRIRTLDVGASNELCYRFTHTPEDVNDIFGEVCIQEYSTLTSLTLSHS
jgi:hypothetical protein